jgi:nicotinamidase-related amidase
MKTPLILNAKHTALVLIDLQNWILGMPLLPHDVATVVGNAVRLAAAIRTGGGIVVPVRVAFSTGYPELLKVPVDEPATLPAGGIPEAALAFAPEIESLGADLVITKRQWSAFYGTELELQLRRRGVDTIILCGVATNFGVESTARDAWQHNYAVVVAEDACASRDAAMHRFAIEKILPRVTRVRSTADIVAALVGTQA